MKKEIRINGLKIPDLMISLMSSGKWKLPENKEAFKEVFGKFGSDACLYSLEYMPIENGSHWLNETWSSFLGRKDSENFPGDIDPKKAIIFGDLGIGYDQPIVLDYRENSENPRILTLIWRGNSDSDNRWVLIANDLEEFLKKIGVL